MKSFLGNFYWHVAVFSGHIGRDIILFNALRQILKKTIFIASAPFIFLFQTKIDLKQTL